MPIALSHRITNRLTEPDLKGEVNWLRPDSKSQVTVEYDATNPFVVDTVVVSTQHAPSVDNATIRDFVINKVIKSVIPAELVKGDIKYHYQSDWQLRRWWSTRRLRFDVVARSSWIRTVVGGVMVVVHSAARIQRKWIAARLTWHVTSQRISLPPAWQTAAKFSWRMQSVFRAGDACMLIRKALVRSLMRRFKMQSSRPSA